MDFVYRFPVVKGVQATREYYIAMIPLKMIPKLFTQDEEYVPRASSSKKTKRVKNTSNQQIYS